MAEQEQRLTLVVQKSGRLTNPSQQLLRDCGLRFDSPNGDDLMFVPVRNFPLDLSFDRDDDIAPDVENGGVDTGIVGQNLVRETGAKIDEICRLGFGKCQIIVAAQPKIKSLKALTGKRVDTAMPNITMEYFRQRGVSVEVRYRAGSAENAFNKGASAIVDASDTGRSLLRYKLRKLGVVMKSSEAALIANRELLRGKGSLWILEELEFRIGAVLNGRNFYLLTMNAPDNVVPRLGEITQGVNSPTVRDLSRPGWKSVEVAVSADEAWEKTRQLKEAGATGIIGNRVDFMIP